MIAAFLYSQLENIDKINQKHLDIWNAYNEFFSQYDNIIRRPYCPSDCKHNAHMYYLLFNDLESRTKFIDYMKANNISTVFHYIPLHSSPAGKKYCRTFGNMNITDKISDILVRLPLYYELNDEQFHQITKNVSAFFENM